MAIPEYRLAFRQYRTQQHIQLALNNLLQHWHQADVIEVELLRAGVDNCLGAQHLSWTPVHAMLIQPLAKPGAG